MGQTEAQLRAASNYKKKTKYSVDRVLNNIYNNQKHSSKKRGHVPPNYSWEEFKQWSLAQPDFNALMATYEMSFYDVDCKPSADRLDEDLPYTFSNLRMVSWYENRQAQYEERKITKIE